MASAALLVGVQARAGKARARPTFHVHSFPPRCRHLLSHRPRGQGGRCAAEACGIRSAHPHCAVPRTRPGPSLLFSFLLGAVACIFTGLSYSEFAARVPIAGSAYTYAYTSFGELAAWMIGWNLTLEYAISAAAIARSWADYWLTLWGTFGVHMPSWLATIPLSDDFQLSIFAALIVLLCSGVMLVGIKESSTMNVVITILNVLILTFVVVAGATTVDTDNWTVVNDSFVPYGPASIVSGAGVVFFSFLGFDMVSSLAEEVKKPQRDMPIGIIGSLATSGVIYVAVCLVVTGMVPFTALAEQPAPLAYAFRKAGMEWASYIVTVGSIFGLTTATFTCLLGQPRVFYRMSADGLLFPLFSQLNANYVPVAGTLITGAITAAIAFFVSLEALADAISVGTLFAFTIVDAGVVILRGRSRDNGPQLFGAMGAFCLCCFMAGVGFHSGFPLGVTVALAVAALALCLYMWWAFPPVNVPPTFQCPAVPFVPCLGIAVNLVMMAGLDPSAWLRLGAWTLVGLVIYFLYSVRFSKLRLAAARGKLDLQGAGGGTLGIEDDDAADLTRLLDGTAAAGSPAGVDLAPHAPPPVRKKGGLPLAVPVPATSDEDGDAALADSLGSGASSYSPPGDASDAGGEQDTLLG